MVSRRKRGKFARRNEYVEMRNNFYSYITTKVEDLPLEGSLRFKEMFEAFKAGWVASRPSSRLVEHEREIE